MTILYIAIAAIVAAAASWAVMALRANLQSLETRIAALEQRLSEKPQARINQTVDAARMDAIAALIPLMSQLDAIEIQSHHALAQVEHARELLAESWDGRKKK